MKILNVILSIVIFIMAAASAAFSYFLFEKRAQFVDGWSKMASAIHESATALDKKSGTKEADKLTVEELAHENYDELDNKLPLIVKQSKAVIAQRDAMADMFYRIDKLVGAGNDRNSDAYCSIADYSGRIKNVNNAVQKTIRIRDNNYNKIAQIARKYRVSVQTTKLKRGDSDSLSPLEQYMASSESAKVNYRTGLANIGRRVGASVSSRDADSKKSGDSVLQAVNQRLAQLAKVARELAQAKRDIQNRDRSIRSKDASIKSLNAQLKNAKNQLLQIKRIQLKVTDDFVPWLPGSVEARERISGKVIAINEEYGYIVVDLGKNTIVNQNNSGKSFPVSPRVESGMELFVVRAAGGDKVDGSGRNYLTKITLDKIGDDKSTANMPKDNVKIQVGDQVYYSISKK